MSIITRQENIDGRWYTWVIYNELNCTMFETEKKLTEQEAQLKLDDFMQSLNKQNTIDGSTNL